MATFGKADAQDMQSVHQNRIWKDIVRRESRLAYEWHDAKDAYMAKHNALQENVDQSMLERPPSPQFEHKNAPIISTGRKGRISGFSGHVRGAKEQIGVQDGEYGEWSYSSEFDRNGFPLKGPGSSLADLSFKKEREEREKHEAFLYKEICKHSPRYPMKADASKGTMHYEAPRFDRAARPTSAALHGRNTVPDQQRTNERETRDDYVSSPKTSRYNSSHMVSGFQGHVPGRASMVGF